MANTGLAISTPRPVDVYVRNTRSPSRRNVVSRPMSSPTGHATPRTEYQGSVYPMNSRYGGTSSHGPSVSTANDTPAARR